MWAVEIYYRGFYSLVFVVVIGSAWYLIQHFVLRERKRDKAADRAERDDASTVVCRFFRETRGEMRDVWFVSRMRG